MTPQVGRSPICHWGKRRNSYRKNEEVGQSGKHTKLWMCLVVKGQCCKEQYCLGTWNVRSINQGKLEVVKQEMARVNIDILGISELKQTGMDEFNSDTIISTTVGKNPLEGMD